jgi:hypothetical protein
MAAVTEAPQLVWERIGFAGPFGRQRIVSALPTAEPPRWIKPHTVVHDTQGAYLADPQGNLIGVKGLWCNRILSARWVEDTRRIS